MEFVLFTTNISSRKGLQPYGIAIPQYCGTNAPRKGISLLVKEGLGGICRITPPHPDDGILKKKITKKKATIIIVAHLINPSSF